MGINCHQRKGERHKQGNTKLGSGRTYRRNWLKRFYGNDDRSTNAVKSIDTSDHSMADVEHPVFQTPLPLLRENPVAEPAGPNKDKVDHEQDKHLLPSSSVSSMRFSTPSTSEEEVEAFYTCPSSPIKSTLPDLSAFPATPTKISRASRKDYRHRPATLVRRMEANHKLRQAFQDHSSADVAGGFLADPVPINFPSRRSPKMNKTEFELYLERALSKKPEGREDDDQEKKIKTESGCDIDSQTSIRSEQATKMSTYNNYSKYQPTSNRIDNHNTHRF